MSPRRKITWMSNPCPSRTASSVYQWPFQKGSTEPITEDPFHSSPLLTPLRPPPMLVPELVPQIWELPFFVLLNQEKEKPGEMDRNCSTGFNCAMNAFLSLDHITSCCVSQVVLSQLVFANSKPGAYPWRTFRSLPSYATWADTMNGRSLFARKAKALHFVEVRPLCQAEQERLRQGHRNRVEKLMGWDGRSDTAVAAPICWRGSQCGGRLPSSRIHRRGGLELILSQLSLKYFLCLCLIVFYS